ncbi:hypothetical protein [Phreatobacter sp.]|uniref:hypothetical protein n=1 Tax=Phreatobacter sp. TaxID=1966341 RepID=UPI003F6EA060
MGLKISTISRLPVTTDRDYFIYFLDYGWDEPLTRAMYNNFDQIAEFAAGNRTLVIAGLNRTEFANEVLSWHRVNGEDANELLPAIMITDCDPRLLAEANDGGLSGRHRVNAKPERFLLIPLAEHCKTETDVAQMFERIKRSIQTKTPLGSFEIVREVKRADSGLSDALILKPNLFGVGLDLNRIWQIGRERLWPAKK